MRELNSLVPEAHLYTGTTKFKSICIIKSYQVFATKMNYVFSFSLPLSYCEEQNKHIVLKKIQSSDCCTELGMTINTA